METHIAVISADMRDFINWIDKMGLVGVRVNSPRDITVGDTVYHCIYKPTQLISLTLDSIVEADNAQKNDAYSSILSIANSQLKP